MTTLLQVLIASEMLAANEISGVEGGNKLIEKSRKLSKAGKVSKSQKLAKWEKKLPISGNSPNLDAKKNGPSFLTPKAKASFNCL